MWFQQMQEKALAAATQAHTAAQGLVAKVSENTMNLAEQATSASSQAVDSATQHLQSLHLPKAPWTAGTPSSSPPSQPGAATPELQELGITPPFRDFVRSLTYSTFRDFPVDSLPPLPQAVAGDAPPTPGGSMRYLTPWQEAHALAVTREVHEVNELRFVLCPKRMSDATFWRIYFALAQKLLPPEAFDPDYRPRAVAAAAAAGGAARDAPGGSATGLPTSVADFQGRLAALGRSAQEWGAQTKERLRSAAGAGPGAGAAAGAGAGSAAARGADAALTQPAAGGSGSRDLNGSLATAGSDEDLDGYLRKADRALNGVSPARGKAESLGGDGDEFRDAGSEAGPEHDGKGPRGEEEGSSGDEDDFERYLDELNGAGEGGRSGSGGEGEEEEGAEDSGSGEALDLEEYMKDL